MKNARRLLRKLDYLPRWAWYMLSLFIGGPIGPFVVYLVFHVLTKAADDEETEQDSVDWGASYDRSGRTYADADCTVTDDAEIEDAWQKTESSASRARREAQPTESTQTDSADDEVSEVIREGGAAMAPHPSRQRPDSRSGTLRADRFHRKQLRPDSLHFGTAPSAALSASHLPALLSADHASPARSARQAGKKRKHPQGPRGSRAHFAGRRLKSIQLSVSRSKRWMNTASSIWKARWTSCATCSNPTA